MQIFSKTDVGLVRESNQDACRYGHFGEDCAWAVVCDGMGGQNGGNIASKLAVDSISDAIQRLYTDEMNNDELSNLLIEAVQNANNIIFDKACKDMTLSGMGTTAELAFIRNNTLYIVHVGDSRAYIYRDGKITQVTTDHSLVQEMIEKGELTPEQAKTHPNKNLITRALGVTRELKLDFIEAPFDDKDILILATDGLTNYVSENELISILHDDVSNSSCEHLVDRAKSAGGADNITVALMLM